MSIYIYSISLLYVLSLQKSELLHTNFAYVKISLQGGIFLKMLNITNIATKELLA